MSSLSKIKSDPNVLAYFKEELELDEEELNRRIQLYLEVFPFIAMDFRLREDCALIHRSLKINNSSVTESPEISPSLKQKINKYNDALKELRRELELSEIEININE